MRGTSRGKSVAGGKDGAVAKENRENGALWGNGSPEDKESGGLEKNEEPEAGRRGRRGRARDEVFSRTGKKIPGPSKRAGAKRRSRLHRMVHTGISGKEILRFVNRRQTEGDEF